MTTPIIRLTAAVTELPAAQREVLLPVFAWALMQHAPEGAQTPEGVLETVSEFFESLGPDQSTWGDAIEARFKAAGITSATLQALALQAGGGSAELAAGDFAQDIAKQYQARSAPKEGQAKSGPAARFDLLGMTPPKGKKGEP